MDFNIWQLLAGIGILLFGMNIFEHAIKFLGGNKLKDILHKYTNNGWTSIFTGFWTTSVLQSSSLLSLLVLAFAGAGVLALKNAIGLIFGANIGSPVLPLLAAFIGFGSFKISAFALPLIAIGGLALIFNLNEKQEQRAKLLVGFGLLFIGLDFMKESVEAIKATFDLAQYADMSLWKFGVLGIIVTFIIQSSGASNVMALAALDGGIISFPASIAIAMGSNLGTTSTAIIGSLGGGRIKRQIALSHIIFNVLLVAIGAVLFRQYIWFTNDILGFKDDPIMGSAVLNIIFNASVAILFGFFLAPFAKLIQRLVPIDTDSDILRIEQAQMNSNNTTVNIAHVYALHEDRKKLIDQVFRYNIYTFGFDPKSLHDESVSIEEIIHHRQERNKQKHADMYDELQYTSDLMLEYLLPAKLHKLPKYEAELLESIEQTIYASTKSAKAIKNIYRDIQDLAHASGKTIQEIRQKILQNAAIFYQHAAYIIDRTHEKESFGELSNALHSMKKEHYDFINYITKELSRKLTKHELQELNIPTLLNLDQYFYQGSKKFLQAVQYTYLNTDESKLFKKIESVEEH